MVDSRRTIQEIYGLDVEVLYSEYRAVNIDKVVIDGNTYTNYGSYSFIWEKSYIKEPKRASDGSIQNLNSYQTFILPHFIIDFSIISIDDWRSIIKQSHNKNEFLVECYDPIYDRTTVQKMYFDTEEMPKLNLLNRRRFESNRNVWEDFIAIAGVESYKLEMIGTKAPLDLVSVVYHKNPPSDLGLTDETIGEDDVYKGQEIIVGQVAQDWYNETFDGRYQFTKWNTQSNPVDKDKNNYLKDTAYIINDTLVLYAQWESTATRKLHFSYGLSEPEIQNGQYWYSKEVSKGKAIGTLPTINPSPSVTYEEKEYHPYTNGGWYRTPTKGNGTAVATNTPYWSDYDSTIYCLYDSIMYSVTYITNTKGISISPQYAKYGDQVSQPELYIDGYTFDGWFLDETFTKKLSGTMPPYHIILYAKWTKQE